MAIPHVSGPSTHTFDVHLPALLRCSMWMLWALHASGLRRRSVAGCLNMQQTRRPEHLGDNRHVPGSWLPKYMAQVPNSTLGDKYLPKA